MLKTIRKYRTSVLGFVAIALVALAMSGFGVDLIQRRHEPFAIKINERIISFSQFHDERRNLEARYREMFGQNFDQMAGSLNLNLNEQTKDKLIMDALLEEAAESLGFYASNNAVAEIIHSELFAGGFDAQRYRAFLRSMGMTSEQFEESLRRHAVRNQLSTLLNDASFASRRETLTAVELEDTKYNAAYLEISPDAFMAPKPKAKPVKAGQDLPAVSAQEIEEYYAAHSTDFEQPAKAAYDYLVLEPHDFVELVEVTEDDLEVYYSDNLSQFTTAEEIKVRHIQSNIPQQGGADKKEAVRKKAAEVLAKAQAGEPFEALAKAHSDDIATALSGGELGWITRGKMPKAFDNAAFKLLEGEISPLIETAGAFYIVKVEEHRPPRQKELTEVQAQIEAEIRRREAPAYTKSKAEELFEEFADSALSLAEFAAQNNLRAPSSTELQDARVDPPELPGLSAQILQIPDEPKQLIDIGEKSVIAAIREYKEAQIAPLGEVKDKVIENIQSRNARQAARDAAQQIVAGLSDGSYGSLADAAKAFKLSLEEAKDLTRGKAAGIFAAPEVHTSVFSTAQAMAKPSRFFEAGGNFYVFQVTAISRPSPEDVEAKVLKSAPQESARLGSILLSSLLNRLKAEAKIDIDPYILSRE